MKKNKNVIALYTVSMLFLSSCASVHNGNYANVETGIGTNQKSTGKQSASGLLLSGQEVKSMASRHITQIDFTFENKTGKWIHIKSVKLNFGSQEANEAISIPVGADLDAWIVAIKQNQAIKDYNFNLAMASIGAVGAGIAATSGNSQSQKNIGNFALAGASAALTVNSVRNQLNSLELAKVVPDNHILSSNFVVPPKMHTKKWVAIYSENPYELPYIDSITLEITTADNKIEKLKLPFRISGISSSEWQKDHPDSNSSKWNVFLENRKTEARRNNTIVDVSKVRSDYIKELMKD